MAPAAHTLDYYCILEVESSATPDQITKAYRNLALKRHPDKNPEAGATAAFQIINKAYEVLKDTAQRQRYDKVDYPRITGEPVPSPLKRRPRSNAGPKPNHEFESQYYPGFGSEYYPQPQSNPQGQSSSRPQFTRDTSSKQAYRTQSRSKFGAFQQESPEPKAGNVVYHVAGQRFEITPIMKARARMEARSQEIEDHSALRADVKFFNEFAAKLRGEETRFKSNISEEVIMMFWRSDPECIKYCAAQKAATAERERQYFKNAFPKFLKADGELPVGWSDLWAVFCRDHAPPASFDNIEGAEQARKTWAEANRANVSEMAEAAAATRAKEAADRKRLQELDSELKAKWEAVLKAQKDQDADGECSTSGL